MTHLHRPASPRVLIVNADDLGLSDGVNRGIIEAHDRGVVTSASLMVRQPAAEAAVALARQRPAMSVGLHIDLGEWVYREGAWVESYRRADPTDFAAVEREITEQLEVFRGLCGSEPTHLDAHQHAHREGPARQVVAALGVELGVPVRAVTPGIAYRGDFYGQTGKGEPYRQGVTVEHLIAVIGALDPGVSELGCHPGYADGLASVYASEREAEVEALRDLRVREAIVAGGIHLASFASPAIRELVPRMR